MNDTKIQDKDVSFSTQQVELGKTKKKLISLC